MPKPRRKVLIPNPRLLQDWKQAATQQIPSDGVTVLWIIEGLLYRIRQLSNSEKANYVRKAIREMSALEKSPLPRDSKKFEFIRFTLLSMIIEGTPKCSHHLPALQVQKSILIDRLEQFERSNRNNMALWLQAEEETILQELKAFACYCNYATSLQKILISRNDLKPICNRYTGIKLIHVILGTLHNLSATTIETLLKIPPQNVNYSPDFDHVQKFMDEVIARH